MHEHEFSAVVELIRREHPRFEKEAYLFVRQALDFTIARLEENEPKRASRHVKGQELLEGIRDFALDQYGPMTLTLFRAWGIERCRDFGEIVFQLVDYGVLGKTEDDKIEDFGEVYDFAAAFSAPFLPSRADWPRRQSASARE